MPRHSHATIGAAEHGNSAVLVTLGPGGQLLDRRSIDLTRGLPTHPYHHEGAWAVGRYLDSPWARPIPLADAIVLIKRVHLAADAGARSALAELAASISMPIKSIALRRCPTLPPTIEERIADNRAQVVADSVMYRQALAGAASEIGWSVHWYEPDSVFEQAAAVIGKDVQQLLQAMGKSIGPPWQARHKLAASAALAASGRGATK